MPVETLTAIEDGARLVLAALMRHRGLSGAEMSRRVGQTRQSIHDKLIGKNRITLADIGRFADVLQVDPALFLSDSDSAIRWTLDHPSAGPSSPNWSWSVAVAVARRDHRRPAKGPRCTRRPILGGTVACRYPSRVSCLA